MKKTIIFILISILVSSVSAQMTIELIKPGYYTDRVNTYYVITGYATSHPDMFPAKRSEIEIVDKEMIAEISTIDSRGILMEWDSFNTFFSTNHKNITSPASTIAVKIPNLIIESPNKLRIIDDYYAYYERRVFRCHLELKGANFETFKIIDKIYSKDKSNVFYLGKRIVEANVSRFKIITQLYSKDDKHVYFKGEVLPNANPKKFQTLGYYYQKDDSFVWDNEGAPINADAETLKALYVLFSARNHTREEDSYYAVDKNNVYYGGGNILISANPKTFKVIVGMTNIYGMDEKNVYRSGEIIQGADSRTFKVVEKGSEFLEYDAYDKNHQYRNGIKLMQVKNKKH